MLDLFNLPTPQGCDIQMFYTNRASTTTRSWVKPRGVSNVYMMLIGPGGSGSGGTGGGSGAVTVWYGSALNVPDQLRIAFASASARVQYYASTGAVTLLTAEGNNATAGGAATVANQFAASGYYQSVAGQNGTTGAVTASATTFLGAGPSTSQTATANYGYTQTNGNGIFQMQPIIVGLGGASGIGIAAIGCGGIDGSSGGPGFVLIASW